MNYFPKCITISPGFSTHLHLHNCSSPGEPTGSYPKRKHLLPPQTAFVPGILSGWTLLSCSAPKSKSKFLSHPSLLQVLANQKTGQHHRPRTHFAFWGCLPSNGSLAPGDKSRAKQVTCMNRIRSFPKRRA